MKLVFVMATADQWLAHRDHMLLAVYATALTLHLSTGSSRLALPVQSVPQLPLQRSSAQYVLDGLHAQMTLQHRSSSPGLDGGSVILWIPV